MVNPKKNEEPLFEEPEFNKKESTYCMKGKEPNL